MIAWIITIIAVLICIYCVINRKKTDDKTIKENEKILQEYQRLHNLRDEISDSLQKVTRDHSDMLHQNNQLEISIEEKKHRLSEIQEIMDETLKNQENLSEKAFENFWKLLENKYKDAEKENDDLMETLKESYSNLQAELMRETEQYRSDLEKIRSTRAAAMEAQRKEKEIKSQLAFYCLTPTAAELDDVKRLERIKPDLHNPRILSMLIWSTYFQKPMTALCNNIIGTNTVTGIYKITNQQDDMCYIGQAVDVAKRWKEHAKCGLGIDTPVGNKLYKAMIKDGLWNFSWELLEECSREELDKKEKFYISLYQSYDYGYNSNAGNGK